MLLGQMCRLTELIARVSRDNAATSAHVLWCVLQISREELEAAAAAVGPFGSDNRAGIQGTLHRISALRSRKGSVVGLTCRVGRAVSGHVDMIQDILAGGREGGGASCGS